MEGKQTVWFWTSAPILVLRYIYICVCVSVSVCVADSNLNFTSSKAIFGVIFFLWGGGEEAPLD